MKQSFFMILTHERVPAGIHIIDTVGHADKNTECGTPEDVFTEKFVIFVRILKRPGSQTHHRTDRSSPNANLENDFQSQGSGTGFKID